MKLNADANAALEDPADAVWGGSVGLDLDDLGELGSIWRPARRSLASLAPEGDGDVPTWHVLGPGDASLEPDSSRVDVVTMSLLEARSSLEALDTGELTVTVPSDCNART